jgi:hypothetical protein
MLSIAQTIGIIGTLLLTLYFSKREVRGISVDIETKVLSDLDEKMQIRGTSVRTPRARKSN